MKKLIFTLVFLASLFVAVPAVFGYTVEEGDTMSEIAREHGVTLEQLAKANPQIENLDLIRVGQVINIDVNEQNDENVIDDNTPTLYKGNMNVEEVQIVPEETTILNTTIAVKQKSSKTINLTESEIDLLARIVRAEAQSEPFEGKVAVAAVVLNRLESPKFPDSIRDVIYQRGQFQPVRNGQINKRADKESLKAVYAALGDMRNIVKDSLFFYNPAIATSRWLDSRKTTAVIGQHVFKN